MKGAVISELEKNDKSNKNRINALNMSVLDLTVQLRSEKKASNILIAQSIEEAEATMVEANLIMEEANKQRSDAQASIIAEKERSNSEVRKERVFSQRKMESRKFCVHHSTFTPMICLLFICLVSYSYSESKPCEGEREDYGRPRGCT